MYDFVLLCTKIVINVLQYKKIVRYFLQCTNTVRYFVQCTKIARYFVQCTKLVRMCQRSTRLLVQQFHFIRVQFGILAQMFKSSMLQSPGGMVSKDSLRNKKRVVKLVTIVTVMFSLSWLPIQLILLLKSLQLYPVTILNISVQVTTPNYG